MAKFAICEYGNHEVEGVECPGALYSYSDPKNGIARDLRICKECLFDHVHFYYPGCANERHLLSMYPSLEARLVQPESPHTPQQMALFA